MISKCFFGILTFISSISFGQQIYSGTLPDSLINEVTIFNLDLSELTDSSSLYYHQSIEEKFQAFDSSITNLECIALTKYLVSLDEYSPEKLDKLGRLSYDLNENQDYDSAIVICKKILSISANNITGHKEIAYAYNKKGKSEQSQKHMAMMSLILKSIFEFGNGTYEDPWIINNFYEGFSIYEAAYRCKPNKAVLMIDKSNRLLGGYNGYSGYLNETLILYSNMNHWKGWLSENDYIKESDY